MLFEYTMIEFAELNFEYINKIDGALHPKPERLTKQISEIYLESYNELVVSQGYSEGKFRKS